VPGSVEAVEVAAARFARAAALAGEAGPEFERALGDVHAWWRGAAADGFARRLEDTPQRLTRAREALGAAAGVLDEWGMTLRANQRAAAELDQMALRLRDGVALAREELDDAAAALEVALGSAVRPARARHEAAAAEHGRLHADLEDVLRRADELRREHLAAAERTAHRLRALGVDAADVVETPDPLFQRLDTLSDHTATLASTLLGGGSGTVRPPAGAAGRFAAALAGR
jgi:uncharacterized protein YukE